jgi:hypothetical protein
MKMASPTKPSEESHGILVNPVPLPVTSVALSPSSPTVTTTVPNVSVTVPNQSGSVSFSLVVTDNLGNESSPAILTVNIQSPPVAVLTGPESTAAGAVIELSGSRSAPSGSIASYKFSLLPAAGVILPNPIVNPIH